MDLNAVAVFVKIVESGSFSQAAKLMQLPKTTVSARLAALEQALGVSLIQRTTRKLHVTEAGRKYFDHCVMAIRELEDGRAELSATNETPHGLFRITAPVDIGHTLFPRIIEAYIQAYPDVTVELLITNRVLDLIGDGIDLAMRSGILKDSSLVSRRFIDLGATLWTTPSYLESIGAPTHPRDLARFQFVGYGQSKTIALLKGNAVVDVPVTGRVRSDDFETNKAFILLGSSIGWLPDFLAQEDADKGLLVPVLPDWNARAMGKVHFLYTNRRYASTKLRAFIDMALALAASRTPAG